MYEKWPDRLEVFLLIMLGGFVFWPNGVSSIALILLVALRLLRSQTLFLLNTNDLLLLTPALISGISWALGGFANDGIREVQLWATLLGAMVVFKHSAHTKAFVSGFIGFSLAQALALLAFLAFSDPFSTTSFSYHLRETVASTFHLHPTYLSAVWSWAALLALSQTKWKALPRYGVFFTLAGVAALCGGRMPVLAFFTVLCLYAFTSPQVLLWQKRSFAALLFIAVATVWLNPVMHERFSELNAFSVNYEEGELLTSAQVRTGIWNCALITISDYWPTGVGTGHTRSVLEDCYRSYEQAEFFEGEFNTHNEWLHFWLSAGILGGLLFMAYCAWMLIHSISQQNLVLLYFLVFYFLISLTENYFSRQTGMMFFSFFALTYWFHPQRQSTR